MKILGATDLIFENLPAACLTETPVHVMLLHCLPF